MALIFVDSKCHNNYIETLFRAEADVNKFDFIFGKTALIGIALL